MPGVHLVLTGRDPAITRARHPAPAGAAQAARRHARRRPRRSPRSRATSSHYAGDPVAFVVAETLHQAKDAAEAIEVDYEPLPAVAKRRGRDQDRRAHARTRPIRTIRRYLFEVGDKAAVERAFAGAAHVVKHRMVINRITTNAMEPRGCLAEYDQRDDRYTLRCTVQGPHVIRRALASEVLKVPETQVRVISENVGGGFGMKGALYNEYILCVVAAKLIGQPVKWISERSEGLLVRRAGARQRDRGRARARQGRQRSSACVSRHSPTSAPTITRIAAGGPPTVNIGVLAGTYVIPAAHVEVTGVLTNTMLTGPYRGAGRPEAAYVIETMVDLAARELGLDPAELRRRNTIPASGDAVQDRAGLHLRLRRLRSRISRTAWSRPTTRALPSALSASRAQRGKLRGIGISNTVEASNAGLIEHAEIRFNPTGTRHHPGRLA